MCERRMTRKSAGRQRGVTPFACALLELTQIFHPPLPPPRKDREPERTRQRKHRTSQSAFTILLSSQGLSLSVQG